MAFYACTGMENIKLTPEVPPTIFDNTFSHTNVGQTSLVVNVGFIDVYSDTEGWDKFQSSKERNEDGTSGVIQVRVTVAD